APPDSVSKAFIWLFAASVISGLIGVFANILLNSIRYQNLQGVDVTALQGGSAITGVICVPVFALIGVILSAFVIVVTNVVAKALGGTGTFNKLMYTCAAFLAPLTIVTSIISIVPLFNCFNVILWIYGLVLNVTAVKAVHQFDWGKAIISSIVIWIA